MLRRIEAWIASIVHAEVDRSYQALKKDIADMHAYAYEGLSHKIEDAIAEVKNHVSKAISGIHDPLKQAAAQEINRNFENILTATRVAAQESLAEARKSLRMVCNVCGHMSWKFIVTEAGKIVCGDCQSRGAK